MTLVSRGAVTGTVPCETCGYNIVCIWGDETIQWTGSCASCGTIVMFVTKEEIQL